MTRIDLRFLPRTGRRGAVLLALLLLAGCTPPPPAQRPREGAAPLTGVTPIRLEQVVPPTLAAASRLSQTPTPTVIFMPPASSPGIAGSPGPLGSPGRAPMFSSLQPSPGATLPAGDIVISARVSGSTDLIDVAAFVDGEEIAVEPVDPPVRMKIVSFVRTFMGGTHEVRIQARDENGQLGGYRWQFSVGSRRQPAEPTATVPPPPTSAIQTRTPIPFPTRRPTVVLPTLPVPTPMRPAPR